MFDKIKQFYDSLTDVDKARVQNEYKRAYDFEPEKTLYLA